MRRSYIIVTLGAVVLSLSILFSVTANAHSGGLNASGCHAGSQPYHCHRSSSEMVRTSDGRNRLRCNLGSQSKECVDNTQRTGQPPTSSSAGFDIETHALQMRLIQYCSGLSVSFADGIFGPLTRSTLMRFQQANNLSVDGILGPDTAEALQNSRASC